MIKNKNNKTFKLIFIFIGVLLIIFGIISLFAHNKEVKTIYKVDDNSLNAYFNSQENTSSGYSDNSNSNIIKYIAVLEIPKINLKQGIPYPNSKDNNVDRNIMITENSSLPDKENGLMVLASHSGNSAISYFKSLYKLAKGDTFKIHYNNNIYEYEINNIYEIQKNGTLNVKRDTSKNTVILITCTKNNNKTQTVYVAYRK